MPLRYNANYLCVELKRKGNSKMKILNKIIAFFKFNGESRQMELSGAEVRNKGVFLHPIDDPHHVIFIKSNTVDIVIDNNAEIKEDNISVIDKEVVKQIEPTTRESIDNTDVEGKPVVRPLSYSKFMPSKRRFSIMLYQDEYDMLIKNITEHGYKKAEYVLACINSAKKKSFENTYKKYNDEHKKRYRADVIEAKKTQANVDDQPNVT